MSLARGTKQTIKDTTMLCKTVTQIHTISADVSVWVYLPCLAAFPKTLEK